MLKIFNTLSRRKEEFRAQNPPQVKMYTCGVTVYDDSHIGHGRSLYIFEVIRRYLEYRGFQVDFVRNITDVDDKIINRAQEVSREEKVPLKVAFNMVREKYLERYYEDLTALEIPPAGKEPLATENIPEMIEFIQGLIDKGFAYPKKGSVYFFVRKFPSYGRLSGKKIDELDWAVRIEPDPFKEDPLDFALWKQAKENEPYWESPWGRGRPGWHIECSVMSQKYLETKTLDIHGGGSDLIFPHHENEVAQSEALNEQPFSYYWIHHGLLNINGQKMAKSLGNYITLKEAIKKYSSDLLKIIYLSTSYRSPLDFSQDKIKEARRVRERVTIFIRQMRARLGEKYLFEEIERRERIYSHPQIHQLHERFQEYMDDDFNMPGGLSLIFELISLVNQNLDKERSFFKEAFLLLYSILDIFALFNKERVISPEKVHLEEELDEDTIRHRVEERTRLRREKKFAQADAIRKELFQEGIVLEDQPNGETIWYRK